jgi:hypothetical protein
MQDVVQSYVDRGWVPVPIPRGEKGPKVSGWQKWSLPLDEAQLSKFRNGGNIGVLLGEPSGGLIDIDLDHALARDLAPEFLPLTNAIFGRKGNPRSHYLFYVEDFGNTKQFQGAGLGMILEVRSTGGQTVFPPSTHPSGETVEWTVDDQPAKVDWDTLLRAASKLAAATVIAANLEKGFFHNARLCLAGALRKAGWSKDEACHFISAIMEVVEADGIEDLEGCIEDTYSKSEDAIKGISGLSEFIDSKSIAAFKSFLNIKHFNKPRNNDPLIEEINKTFCVILNEGKLIFVRYWYDPENQRHRYSFMRYQDFRLWVQKYGSTRENFANTWLKSSSRREYPNGITMAEIGEEPEGTFNLWTGFPVEPKAGNWDYMKEHILVNIAGGNEEHYHYILKLMALGVQQPFQPWGVALVIHGAQRTGKTIFVDEYDALFGEHYLQIVNPKHLLNNFNSHLLNVCLINANEAMWGGDRAPEQILKSYVTDKTLVVEPKGIDAYSAKNRLKIIITGNETWQVPVGPDSKRYAVFEIETRNQADKIFFGKLKADLKNGGRAAMLHDLREIDLTDFNPEDIPQTSGLAEQRLLSLRPLERWLYDVLSRGWLLEWNLIDCNSKKYEEQTRPWPAFTSVHVVQRSFREWCRENQVRYYPSSDVLRGRLFANLGLKVSKKSNVMIPRAEEITSNLPVVSGNSAERIYELPPLEEFRERFAKHFRLPENIWD